MTPAACCVKLDASRTTMEGEMMTTTTTITAGEARAMYDEFLDEHHGEFAGRPGSKVLLAVDPIAYRVGLSDYIDMLGSDDGYEIEED